MTPVVYQNHAGTESLWADSTVCPELACNGRQVFAGINSMSPVAISLLRRRNSKTGPMAGTVYVALCPASLWITAGNTAIGYATSGSIQLPGYSLCRASCGRSAE